MVIGTPAAELAFAFGMSLIFQTLPSVGAMISQPSPLSLSKTFSSGKPVIEMRPATLNAEFGLSVSSMVIGCS